MPDHLNTAILIAAAITASFFVVVLVTVRVMRWLIVHRHPEIAVAQPTRARDAAESVASAKS